MSAPMRKYLTTTSAPTLSHYHEEGLFDEIQAARDFKLAWDCLHSEPHAYAAVIGMLEDLPSSVLAGSSAKSSLAYVALNPRGSYRPLKQLAIKRHRLLLDHIRRQQRELESAGVHLSQAYWLRSFLLVLSRGILRGNAYTASVSVLQVLGHYSTRDMHTIYDRVVSENGPIDKDDTQASRKKREIVSNLKDEFGAQLQLERARGFQFKGHHASTREYRFVAYWLARFWPDIPDSTSAPVAASSSARPQEITEEGKEIAMEQVRTFVDFEFLEDLARDSGLKPLSVSLHIPEFHGSNDEGGESGEDSGPAVKAPAFECLRVKEALSIARRRRKRLRAKAVGILIDDVLAGTLGQHSSRVVIPLTQQIDSLRVIAFASEGEPITLSTFLLEEERTPFVWSIPIDSGRTALCEFKVCEEGIAEAIFSLVQTDTANPICSRDEFPAPSLALIGRLCGSPASVGTQTVEQAWAETDLDCLGELLGMLPNMFLTNKEMLALRSARDRYESEVEKIRSTCEQDLLGLQMHEHVSGPLLVQPGCLSPSHREPARRVAQVAKRVFEELRSLHARTSLRETGQKPLLPGSGTILNERSMQIGLGKKASQKEPGSRTR